MPQILHFCLVSTVYCCSSVTDRNWKGRNTGGALAVDNGVVWQVEGLAGGEIPPAPCMAKSPALQRMNIYVLIGFYD